MIRIASLRELDAAICDHVMQWRRSGPHPIHGSMVWATGNSDTMAPHYSTSPTASYALETKMRDLGWLWSWWEERQNDGLVSIVGLHQLPRPINRILRQHASRFVAMELAVCAAFGVELELVEGWDKC